MDLACSFRLSLCGALFAVLALGTTTALGGSVSIDSTGGTFNVQITSIKEARFKHVVKQQYDFSCGSAALATMLTYHYDTPTGEAEVFAQMFEDGDQEKIKTEGFSLLDMKRYLEGLGYQANGYRADLDKLTEFKIPAIVLINTNGYLHFVIVKGVTTGDVLVADSAFGNRVYARGDFEAMWNGILFVVLDETAAEHFNVDEEWQVRAKAPMGTALMRDGLNGFNLLLPGRDYF